VSAGHFVWRWVDRETGLRPREELSAQWPEGCTVDGQSLRCSSRGLVGRLSIAGVGQTHSVAFVRVDWLGGASRTYTLTAAQPSVAFYGGPEETRSALDIATAYALLGVEHIAGGVDHLAFVAGLLFLVGFRRQLVATITAFTLAHSATLAANVLGWVNVRPASVEVCIALSIVLVASEALRARETLTRRMPELVAFLFGLVHGAGFAGALREVGLPEQNFSLALFAFNVGVEAGQLLAVLLAYVLTGALARLRVPREVLRVPALYAIGVAAVYWSCERALALGAR
jgi:hypothetical protein